MANVQRFGIPGAAEALDAFDTWVEAMADAQETSSDFEDVVELLDRMEEITEFELATPDELAELVEEIGLDTFLKLEQEMKKNKRRLGLLG